MHSTGDEASMERQCTCLDVRPYFLKDVYRRTVIACVLCGANCDACSFPSGVEAAGASEASEVASDTFASVVCNWSAVRFGSVAFGFGDVD